MRVDCGVLDTSVLVEYIAEEPARGINDLFSRIVEGRFRAYLTPLTISELVYVAHRVYREAGISDPNRRALDYVNWLISLSGTEVLDLDSDAAKAAGELKKRFRLALPDIFVIVSAISLDCPAIFLKLESEMEPYEAELRGLGVVFWEEITSSPRNK